MGWAHPEGWYLTALQHHSSFRPGVPSSVSPSHPQVVLSFKSHKDLTRGAFPVCSPPMRGGNTRGNWKQGQNPLTPGLKERWHCKFAGRKRGRRRTARQLALHASVPHLNSSHMQWGVIQRKSLTHCIALLPQPLLLVPCHLGERGSTGPCAGETRQRPPCHTIATYCGWQGQALQACIYLPRWGATHANSAAAEHARCHLCTKPSVGFCWSPGTAGLSAAAPLQGSKNRPGACGYLLGRTPRISAAAVLSHPTNQFSSPHLGYIFKTAQKRSHPTNTASAYHHFPSDSSPLLTALPGSYYSQL